MKDLIDRIARALVDYPQEVEVTVIEGSQATVLELKVAKVDLGKIIGKQGRTVDTQVNRVIGPVGSEIGV